MNNAQNTDEYISITQLNNVLQRSLDQNVGEVQFQGEISEIKIAASGHIYFSVKDEKSQISAVMWKGISRTLSFQPKAGVHVLCRGNPTIYNVTGRLQMSVNFMVLAGEGLLQKKFLELKAKLEREGLFSVERKRRLPLLPASVGIITSASGAVIHDIMVKIRERMPSMKTYLIDVRVQGEGASKEIEEAFSYFNNVHPVDVIILARGGGSLEDLWAFNEERTVRAVFASTIPVVCGVGHEVDVSLSDLAADVRAPTPTAAAEIVVPKSADLLHKLDECRRRLNEYSRWLMPLNQRIDEISFRLQSSLGNALQRAKIRLQECELKVRMLKPDIYVATLRTRLENASTKLGGLLQKIIDRDRQQVAVFNLQLNSAAKNYVSAQMHRLSSLAGRLESISPLKVLARGYSIAEIDGVVIKSSTQVSKGNIFKLRLFEGGLKAKVEDIK